MGADLPPSNADEDEERLHRESALRRLAQSAQDGREERAAFNQGIPGGGRKGSSDGGGSQPSASCWR